MVEFFCGFFSQHDLEINSERMVKMGIYKPGRPFKYESGKNDDKPPLYPGEYRIRDSEGDIKYVGETSDLRRRLNQHIRSGKLSEGDSFEYKIADGRSTSKTRRAHEQEKIKQHNPTDNKSKGGEGRVAK